MESLNDIARELIYVKEQQQKLKDAMKQLIARQRALEGKFTAVCRELDIPGCVTGGHKIQVEQKQSRRRLSRAKTLEVLRQNGVRDPQEIVNKLKASPQTKQVIKIDVLKN